MARAPAALQLRKSEARRFLLAHQRLLPPHQLHGKAGILEFTQHIGCIQFDPIDVVGRNPDLVLQSRLRDHRPRLLEQLLYQERRLLDGWDKVASIYRTSDWPYFERHRARMRRRYGSADEWPARLAEEVVERVRREGPLSSTDFSHDQMATGSWGQPTRVVRQVINGLYAMGKLGVSLRIGTRRAFDLIERLIPAEVLAGDDPHPADPDYQDWHVLRRIRSMGLANPSVTELWLGMTGVRAVERREALARLTERGAVVPVQVERVPRGLVMAAQDRGTLEAVRSGAGGRPRAAFLAPLDNLVWDRQLLEWLFDFEYRWEVYTPAAKRRYGYYVLPVLYGERLIGRIEPAFDRKSGMLTVRNWWWEPGVRASQAMQSALRVCLRRFLRYLDAVGLKLGPALKGKPDLGWMRELSRKEQ